MVGPTSCQGRSALDWRFRSDAALDLAEALRPLLATLSTEARSDLVERVHAMAERSGRRQRRRA